MTKAAIKQLPPGLTGTEVARRLAVPYHQALVAIQKHRYRMTDGRKFSQNAKRKLDPEKADWSKPNYILAEEFGVSRERVRVLRKRLKMPFVEGRGRGNRDCHCKCRCH